MQEQKFYDLILNHKKEEITVEEFCRSQGIEYLGWLAGKEDGQVEDRELVKIFDDYFYLSKFSTSEVRHGLRKIFQSTAKLELCENFKPCNYVPLKECQIIIAVVDLESDYNISHFQRYSKRYAFKDNDIMKAKMALGKEAVADIFVNNRFCERKKFLALRSAQ